LVFIQLKNEGVDVVPGILTNRDTSSSLKDSLAPQKRVWMAQDLNGTMDSEEELNSPTSPLCSSDIKLPASPMDEEANPYTSLRDWEDVDIDEISKQDLIKMWQSTECDLRLQLQKMVRERVNIERQMEENLKRNPSVTTKSRRATPTDL
jgi:hypothetical protein